MSYTLEYAINILNNITLCGVQLFHRRFKKYKNNIHIRINYCTWYIMKIYY